MLHLTGSPLGPAVSRAWMSTRSVHFQTGEPIARVSRANGGLIQRDMRKAARARDVLREIPIAELIARVGKAGELYANAELPMGDGIADARRVRPRAVGNDRHPGAAVPREHEEEHLRARRDGADSRVAHPRPRSRRAVAGLRRRARRPDQLPGRKPGRSASCCRRTHPGCTRCGCRSSRCRSDWSSSRARRSRGRRSGWRRRSSQAGIPREAISIYPGEGDVGAAVLEGCGRSLIFGGTATVDRYRGNPRVQAHGPGLLEDPARRRSGGRLGEVPRRDGRQRVREQRARLHQLLGDLGEPSRPRRSRRRSPSGWPAFVRCRPRIRSRASPRSPCRASADVDLATPSTPTCKAPGVTDVTAKHRDGPRVVKQGRAEYLLPTVVHCDSPGRRDREEGVHVPLRHGGRLPGGADAREDRPDARLQRDHVRPGVPRARWSTPSTSTG